ncbi:hypothetical protein BOTBODRAFT_30589 [Botryobasidium botryosum FD-172 SS1]|uniref:U3 small nucleolar RNA-associated protein 22 n=1 Tax=Botryobasidium botryosum (strain FD-172 SS1) TaxID=930990 RepID=A0A067MPM9_BOTB1|nr:hypothetical protein BOTBODRAFT_30589 [Botryobasidium botryosum FD-172 SS1]
MVKPPKRKNTGDIRKGKAKRLHIAEDDADQVISDDGEQPLQTAHATESGSSDDEDEEGDDPLQSESRKPGPPPKPSAWKAPTTEELRTLKDSTELFKSNAFKLKVDALLPTVRPKASYKPSLEQFLMSLHFHIMSLPAIPAQHPLEAARSLAKKKKGQSGVAVPYVTPLPTEETNWKVGFEKPSDIKVVGSWANGLSVLGKDGRGFVVDVAVEMPSTLFQEKDYLNGRYFNKRAYYLSVLASSIASNSALGVDVLFESSQDNARRTNILLRPVKGSTNDFSKLRASVRLIPCLSPSSPIPQHRLSPSHSNIRTPAPSPESSESQHPTPLYNTDLLRSFTPLSHLLSIYNLNAEVPSFNDGLALLRVWANQRGYGGGSRTVVGFESLGGWWPLLLGYLIKGREETGLGGKKKGKGKTIGRGLSSYQLFRAAMDFLAHHDFTNDPVFMKTSDGHKFTVSEYSDHHQATFVDDSSIVNLLAGVPLTSLELLQHEGRMTLQLLDHESGDPFDALFMKDLREPQTKFDVVIRVDIAGAKARKQNPLDVLDHSSAVSALVHSLGSVIRQALGTRVKVAAMLQPSSQPRPLDQSRPVSSTLLEIGLVLDPTQAPRLVDHGPPADDVEGGENFRDFWGEKAELRRFKDGSISESVVWEVGKDPQDRQNIPGRIVQHVLHRHFGIEGDKIAAFQPQYMSVLTIPADVERILVPAATNSTSFRPVMDAFDQLNKTLKAMDVIPLSLVTMSPVSDGLRYASALPPFAVDLERYAALPDCAKHIPAFDVTLQFERSAKWADDLCAIQKLKLAFFERIATGLSDALPGTKAAVALDRYAQDIEDNCSLEMLLPSGFAFRARIYHDREQTLLERILADKKDTPDSKRREAQAALDLHRRRFIAAPRHHAAITALYHRSPSFSPCVRLVKRWFSSHYISPHISPELIELLCAHVYLSPGSSDAPGSAPTGFARIMAFLKGWNWREELVTVPLYSAAGVEPQNRVKFPDHKQFQAQEAFKTARAIDPAFHKATWCIATEEDLDGTAWSLGGPKGIVADRVRQLATASLACLEAGVTEGNLNVQAMFNHPLDDYDFVIHMDPSVLPRYYQNVVADSSVWSSKTKYINLVPKDKPKEESQPKVDWDPGMLFFRDLERIYGDSMILFYDPLGGANIGGVWNPQMRQKKNFKVFLGFSSLPGWGEGKDNKKPVVTINEDAILIEIERMGQGLVKSISKRT